MGLGYNMFCILGLLIVLCRPCRM